MTTTASSLYRSRRPRATTTVRPPVRTPMATASSLHRSRRPRATTTASSLVMAMVSSQEKAPRVTTTASSLYRSPRPRATTTVGPPVRTPTATASSPRSRVMAPASTMRARSQVLVPPSTTLAPASTMRARSRVMAPASSMSAPALAVLDPPLTVG